MRGELAFELLDARRRSLLGDVRSRLRFRWFRRGVRGGLIAFGSDLALTLRHSRHDVGASFAYWTRSQEIRNDANRRRERSYRSEAWTGASSWFRRGGRRQTLLLRSTRS